MKKLTLLLTTALFASAAVADLDHARQAIVAGQGDQAVIELTRLAGEGSGDAQYELGRLYAEGTLIPRDPSRALLALTLAAANGNRMATSLIETQRQHINLLQLAAIQEELGSLFQKGGPVAINPERAAEWLGERALNPVDFAEEERGELARRVGRLYETKIFGFTTAHSWYTLAEAFGSERAAKDRQRIALFLQPQSLSQSKNESIKQYKRYLKQRKQMIEGAL
jgi:TPR repeat protein